MTQPSPSPDGLTYQQALAAVAAAQASIAATDTITNTVSLLSDSVITTREAASAYAKTLILSLWGSVDPYDGRAVQAFTVAARKHMVTAQAATARTAAASQAQLLSSMGVRVPGVPSNPADVRSPGVDVVAGRLALQRPDSVHVDYTSRENTTVPAAEMTTQGIFNRPARAYRAMVAEGADIVVADDAARQRISDLVDGNVMLSQRFAELEIVQNAVELDRRVIGYRRVIHPELSRTGVCGLCIAAADQLYKVGTLLPLHGNCKCTVAAVTTGSDPADELNKFDLAKIYGEAGGTSGVLLKRTRYQVDEHGEFGPVLKPAANYTPRGAKGKKAAEARLPESESKSEIARRLLPGFETNLAKLRASGLAEGSPQITYHETQIARLRRELSS